MLNADTVLYPFHYLMDLHYSQTKEITTDFGQRFHYLMDLHYSQTRSGGQTQTTQFHYLMDLHYSQTIAGTTRQGTSFTTLWIYTILKLDDVLHIKTAVSLPYGFTLFSNAIATTVNILYVSLPYGFTLFSNMLNADTVLYPFHYLMDLHYSQTN